MPRIKKEEVKEEPKVGSKKNVEQLPEQVNAAMVEDKVRELVDYVNNL